MPPQEKMPESGDTLLRQVRVPLTEKLRNFSALYRELEQHEKFNLIDWRSIDARLTAEFMKMTTGYFTRPTALRTAKILQAGSAVSKRVEARRIAEIAVQSGKIKRSRICSRCGNDAWLDMHHKDYSRPLDIEWVCRKCHTDEHKENWDNLISV